MAAGAAFRARSYWDPIRERQNEGEKKEEECKGGKNRQTHIGGEVAGREAEKKE